MRVRNCGEGGPDQPQPTTRLRTLLGVAAGLTIGLWGILSAQAVKPEELQPEMTIESNRKVPMRDGVQLALEIYRPKEEGRFPVVLVRTPYGRKGNEQQARPFVGSGYVYILADVRGRGDSEGEFTPYANTGEDGFDLIEWAAKQPWSTGRIGTLGGSYSAWIEWHTALLRPPHLAAMVSIGTTGDPGTDIFVSGPSGLPSPTLISWFYFVSGRRNQKIGAVDWGKTVWGLPLYNLDETVGRANPNWKAQIEHVAGDRWWDSIRYQNKLAGIHVPVLHVTNWYDDVQGATLTNFAGVTTGGPREVRAAQKLIVGPGGHSGAVAKGPVDFGPAAKFDLGADVTRWLDYWLRGIHNGVPAEPAVHVFRMGENAWHDEREWPIRRARLLRYYLDSNGRANTADGNGILSEKHAVGPADKYSYDPAKPVVFITEPDFRQIGGPDDYRAVERREDVLVYTSAPITKDTAVCGPIRMELYASSSAPDADFTAMLLDVWPDGFAQRLTDGMVRARFRNGISKPSFIETGRVYKYHIELWNTCQTFKQTHRIRIDISSSAFPKYDRNLNTAEPLGRGTQMRVAEEIVQHTLRYPSSVVLPVVASNN
jgi:putative CocE/NonD family hydrolase